MSARRSAVRTGAVAQQPDDAGPAHAGGDLESVPPEPVGHDRADAGFAEGQFGVAVKVLVHCDQVVRPGHSGRGLDGADAVVAGVVGKFR